MALPSFTVTPANVFDILGNTIADDLVGNGMGNGTPAQVTFTSNVTANTFVTWDGDLYRVNPVVATVSSTGEILRNGESVQLLADDAGLNVEGLQWRCDIGNMRSFWFNAPEDGDTVDLSSAVPVPGVAAVGIVAQGDPVDGVHRVADTIVFQVNGVDIGDPVDISDFVLPSDLAADIHAATSKATPVDADEIPLADSAASFAIKKLTWANIKATLKTYFDTLTTTLTNKSIDADTNTISNLEVDNFKGSAVITSAELASINTDTAFITAKGAKDYADSGVGGGIPLTVIDAKGDLLVGTAADTVARKAVGSNRQALQADSTQTTGVRWATKPALYVQADFGAVGDGAANDTAAVLAAVAALPSDGARLIFEPGVYLCNTVASGVILLLANKANITVEGPGAIIRTSSATATELLRIDTCTDFTLRGLNFEVTGTANIDKAVHYTCASPASVHRSTFEDLFIVNSTCVVRNVYDVRTVSGSNIVYSGMAEFAAGDVGGVVTINYGNTAADLTTPVRTTISAVQTLSSTLAAGINASVTTVTLNTALSTMPSSGWSLKVGTEHMYVTAGGATTTLTVIRGQGSDAIAASHSSGDTAAVYKATLVGNVPFSTSDPVAMMRIETSTSHMNYGLAIGLDHPGASNMDIANTNIRSVEASCACVAGIAVGNGTSGNILDQWGYGITSQANAYGVLMNGGAISLHGADFGENLVDIKRGQPVTQPIQISDIRSEECGMFYEFSGGYTSALPITFDDCVASIIYAEDLVQMRHLSAAPVVMRNCEFYISGVTSNYAQFHIAGPSSTNPCHLVAINVSHNSPSSDPFIGTAANVVKTLINVIPMDSSGAFLESVTLPGSVLTADGTQTSRNKTLVNPTITNYTESVVAAGVVTTAATLALTNGTVQTATLTASTSCTFTMPTAAAGKSFVQYLKQPAVTGGGSAAYTGVKWAGGVAPTITPTAGRMDILAFSSDGTNWYGSFTQDYAY